MRPWALRDFGFRAVVSTSIADIFFSNALKNGLVPVRIDAATHAWLLANPGAEIEIDLAEGRVRLPGGGEAPFAIDPFARHCLLHGIDEMGYLLSQLPAIEAWEYERRGRLIKGTFSLLPQYRRAPASLWGKVNVPLVRLSDGGWESWFGISKG